MSAVVVEKVAGGGAGGFARKREGESRTFGFVFLLCHPRIIKELTRELTQTKTQSNPTQEAEPNQTPQPPLQNINKVHFKSIRQ